jgi:predicted acylesterase/phospholipase RssA
MTYLSILISIIVGVSAQRCKVLSVSGGGSKGAYEVGVMQGVVDILDEEYDVISGVSVGSINALGFSIFDYGK